jgi:hypothetical protein
MSRSWADASHQPMELIRKNGNVLAGDPPPLRTGLEATADSRTHIGSSKFGTYIKL